MRRAAAIAGDALRLVGKCLYWSGTYRLLVWWNRNRPKVILYHACESGESDYTQGLLCNSPPDLFRQHLEYFERHYTVVSLDDLEGGRLPARSLAITFDDGYRSICEGARPALKERGLPATLFVVANVVDNRELLWVNELSWMLRQHPEVAYPLATSKLGLSESARPDEIIREAHDRFPHSELMQLMQSLREATGVDGDQLAAEAGLYVTTSDLARLVEDGFTLGNHTLSHVSLPDADKATVADEVRGGRDFVDRVGGRRAFAYPFGNVDDGVEQCVAELGHTSAFLLGGVNHNWNPLRIARVPIGAQSVAGLFAEIEIVTPIKAWLDRFANR